MTMNTDFYINDDQKEFVDVITDILIPLSIGITAGIIIGSYIYNLIF